MTTMRMINKRDNKKEYGDGDEAIRLKKIV